MGPTDCKRIDEHIASAVTRAHSLDEFSCGKPYLDRRLKTRALSSQEKGFTAVIVVHEANRLLVHYGFAPTAIVPSRLPRSIRTGQPPAPADFVLRAALASTPVPKVKGRAAFSSNAPT